MPRARLPERAENQPKPLTCFQLGAAHGTSVLLARAGATLGANVRSNCYVCPWRGSGQLTKARFPAQTTRRLHRRPPEQFHMWGQMWEHLFVVIIFSCNINIISR